MNKECSLSNTKEKTIAELKEFLYQIFIAREFYQTIKNIDFAIKDYNEQVNIAPAFFSIAYNALTRALVNDTAKIFEQSKKSKNIKLLLKDCLNNIDIFPKTKTIFVSMYEEESNKEYLEEHSQTVNAKSIIEDFILEYDNLPRNRLYNHRNKIYAHNDEIFFANPQKCFATAPLEMRYIEKLLDFADRVCNELLMLLIDASASTQSNNINDIKNLLEKLKTNS